MRSALIVLNPRCIPSCMASIDALDIDKCYFAAMSEVDVYPKINRMIASTLYDRYLILSDDSEPTQEALEKVLAIHDGGHPVVTGYSNLDSESLYVNLSRKPLHEPPPDLESYDLLLQGEVDAYGNDLIPTTFTGFSYTCMSRELWLEHYLETSTQGGQADYVLSWKLQQEGLPIVSHKDTFLYHVKETWNRPDKAHEKRLLVGEIPPSINWKLKK